MAGSRGRREGRSADLPITARARQSEKERASSNGQMPLFRRQRVFMARSRAFSTLSSGSPRRNGRKLYSRFSSSRSIFSARFFFLLFFSASSFCFRPTNFAGPAILFIWNLLFGVCRRPETALNFCGTVRLCSNCAVNNRRKSFAN